MMSRVGLNDVRKRSNLKDGVRPGGLLVGVGRVLGSVPVSVLKQPQKVVRAGRLVPGQSGDVDAGVAVLSDLQHGVGVYQVDHVLVVNLQIGNSHLTTGVLVQLKHLKRISI